MAFLVCVVQYHSQKIVEQLRGYNTETRASPGKLGSLASVKAKNYFSVVLVAIHPHQNISV